MQRLGKPISHECLREHDFFKDRDPKILEYLMEHMSVGVFLPGAEIVKEGDDGDCMYFMNRGKAEVLVGPDDKQVVVLGDGSLFGEMALVGNGKRMATIRAIEVCDCRVIDGFAFKACLRRYPAERLYFRELSKVRLAEIKKAKGGQQGTVSPFRRPSRVPSPCGKLNTLSAPVSRTSLRSDDGLTEDRALMWSLMVATKELQTLFHRAGTTKSDGIPHDGPCAVHPEADATDPCSPEPGQHPMYQEAHQTCPCAPRRPSSSACPRSPASPSDTRSSGPGASRRRPRPMNLEIMLDNLQHAPEVILEPTVPPARAQPHLHKRHFSGRRSSKVACDGSRQMSIGRRWSTDTCDEPKLVGQRSCSSDVACDRSRMRQRLHDDVALARAFSDGMQ